MGGAAEELKQRLSQSIDTAKRKLELLKAEISELHDGDMAALIERRNDIRARLDQHKSLAEQLQSRSRSGTVKSGSAPSTPSRRGSNGARSKSYRPTPSAPRTRRSTW